MVRELSHRVFSLKYRPATFEELVGQAHVRQTLVNTLLRQHTAHGYLFSGPRGVGKTTAARLFAKALNCAKGPGPKICNDCDACREISAGNCLDVIEMDGASNRKIEDVRVLRENVRFAPASCRKKIYIIDEVHMLTHEAFNALLKTLEEPPEHVVFILATTDPQKVPDTIHSRCQELEFHRISPEDLSSLLKEVCRKEKISIDPEAVEKLSEWADGSARDVLVALEQSAAFTDGDVREDAVDRLFGWVDRKTTDSVIDAVVREDRKSLFDLARKIENDGKDIAHFFVQVARCLRKAWAALADGKKPEAPAAAEIPPDAILRMISSLLESERHLRRTRQPALYLAVQLIELIELKRAIPLSAVIRRLEDMESRLANSAPPPTKSADPADLWRKLVQKISSENASLGNYLKEGKAGHISGRVLPILFPGRFRLNKERIADEKNAAVIETALSELTGQSGWRIQALMENAPARDGPVPNGTWTSTGRPPGGTESPVDAGTGDKNLPGKVRAASDLFESRGAHRRE